MDEDLPEIDKNEKMHTDIASILERLTAIENKLNAIAKHIGVIGYDFDLPHSYAQRTEIGHKAKIDAEKILKRQVERERKKKEKKQKQTKQSLK